MKAALRGFCIFRYCWRCWSLLLCVLDTFIVEPVLIVRQQPSYRRGKLVKSYVVTSGTVFALVFAAHVWRAIAEGTILAKNPIFILTTGAALALVLWAWRVVRAMPRS